MFLRFFSALAQTRFSEVISESHIPVETGTYTQSRVCLCVLLLSKDKQISLGCTAPSYKVVEKLSTTLFRLSAPLVNISARNTLFLRISKKLVSAPKL